MLTISDIRWTHSKMANIEPLFKLLTEYIKNELKLKVKAELTKEGIVFHRDSKGLLCLSSVTNYKSLNINVEKDKKRAELKGRPYLKTPHPTQNQYEGFFSCINNTLNELGLNAKVILKEKNDITLRDGKVIYDFPKKKTYPKETI